MSFVKDESLTKSSGVIALNLRLFRRLPLFLKLLPLSIVTILLSSAAPSLFRWYSGKLSSGSERFTLLGLVVLTLLAIFFRIAAWACFEVSGMWSSQGIHHEMVRAMSLTRTTFFDENPSGRLINRLVRDFDEVRSTAIIFVGDLFNASIEILSIAVIAYLASPWAAVMILPLLFVFSYVQFFRSAMLDHARTFSAIATSQVIGRETDLIEGREIFLLYGRAGKLLSRMRKSFRAYVQASALTIQIETWASLWMRIGAEVFSFGVLMFVAMALTRHEIGATMAGVIISSLFGISGSIGWLDFATSMISRSTPHVRRVFEFVDLPKEEDEELDQPVQVARRPLGGGTRTGGDLVFSRYSMSYRKDTPIILDDLSLKIESGSKAALVGRTGSGKTSLVQALLRMVHVRSGDIRLGDQSVFDLDLRMLRRQFGVVPQFPYLFSGSIRSNLDRVGELTDLKLAEALETVGLAYSLDHRLREGGMNLSMGERQLVCLARVIAAERPVILMDEPTSGLDPETDARITSVLQTAFKGKTVLTIAHRRESLNRQDQIIEMSGGRVIWKGSPHEKTIPEEELSL
jgi:ATP-binding cassette subfamily C (CFTR/MRP) protein 1